MIIKVLQIIAALGTIGTGCLALLKPKSIYGFTGLKAESSRGITEIRAVFGGFFIALGAAPLVLQAPAAFQMLGIAYLVVALTRSLSMVVDKSVERSNIISLVIEILFGLVLVI